MLFPFSFGKSSASIIDNPFFQAFFLRKKEPLENKLSWIFLFLIFQQQRDPAPEFKSLQEKLTYLRVGPMLLKRK